MDSFIGWHARRSWRRWPHRRKLAGSHDPFLRWHCGPPVPGRQCRVVDADFAVWLPGVLRQERRRRVRADRLSGFVIRRRIRGGSEVDRGDAALRHRGGRADSDRGRERGDGRPCWGAYFVLYPSSRVLTLVLQYPRRDGPAPRLRKRCCANASCRSRPALIMRRGRSCGRCGETVGGRAVVLDDLADHAPTGRAIVVHRRTGRNRRSTGSPSIGPKSRIISSCLWTRHAL